MRPDIAEYIQALKQSDPLGSQVAHHFIEPPRSAVHARPDSPWSPAVEAMIAELDIGPLFCHQARAIDCVRQGRHVVVATPTASGKTLVFALPILDSWVRNPAAAALALFPLKALAQDQLRAFAAMAQRLPGGGPSAAIYDGDTPAGVRRQIRDRIPNVLLTNPEMLHLALLPHHGRWADFFANLQYVVIDEVHTYRGVVGTHVAMVLQRLQRICARYGSRPVFVFCSATVSNPGEFTRRLSGLPVQTVAESTAPRGRRHLVLMDPQQGPIHTALLLLKAALHRGLRTIVYTQSRRMAELLSLWSGSRSGVFAGKISAYRAGLLPEERRDIEARLADGRLLAVVSTSALELGIDVGDLDLCLLVGYPGSMVSLLQRSGRVGRSGQESATVLFAGDDALDRYLLRHPEEVLRGHPEAAVVNPFNPEILPRHLECAAAEMPLALDEPLCVRSEVRPALKDMEADGRLLRSADGRALCSRRLRPQREVNLRGGTELFQIVERSTGGPIGEIDGSRAFAETHTGAVYLHNGVTYRVEHLDVDARRVLVSRASPNFYTRALGEKETEILQVVDEKRLAGNRIFFGRLKVTARITGYERWQARPRRKLGVFPLDLPPREIRTEGLGFIVPPQMEKAAARRRLDLLGGLHAAEHAAIGILPVEVLADRQDLGGFSALHQPQLEGPVIFIYDGVAGGAGLSRQAFARAESVLQRTRKAIGDCPCREGCPGCIQSPRCGSGNRPLDKKAALFVLDGLLGRRPQRKTPRAETGRVRLKLPGTVSGPVKRRQPDSRGGPFGVLDLETLFSAEEVGGWHRAARMGVSCAVCYDSRSDRFLDFFEADVSVLIDTLFQFDRVVGFNIRRFDYRVLGAYSRRDFNRLPTVDLMDAVSSHLGFRLSLGHLAETTLGVAKSADGLQALRWWKQGEKQKVLDYCRRDVEVTRDLYLYGRRHGHVLFRDKRGRRLRIPVDW